MSAVVMLFTFIEPIENNMNEISKLPLHYTTFQLITILLLPAMYYQKQNHGGFQKNTLYNFPNISWWMRRGAGETQCVVNMCSILKILGVSPRLSHHQKQQYTNLYRLIYFTKNIKHLYKIKVELIICKSHFK